MLAGHTQAQPRGTISEQARDASILGANSKANPEAMGEVCAAALDRARAMMPGACEDGARKAAGWAPELAARIKDGRADALGRQLHRL